MRRLIVFIMLCGTGVFAQTAGPGLPTVYYASKSGATLDCASTNLTGAGCTNNDSILNGILATASAAKPVKLIVDGFTVTGGIVGPATGHWTIECPNWDDGFVIATGSNSNVIRNIPASNGYNTGTPGTAGQNIDIHGCRINGNRGNGTTGDSNSGNARQATNGNWLFGVYLDNMAHVLIDHDWFYDEPSFNLWLNACSDCIVSHNRFDAASGVLNQDGVHVSGPAAQIRIHDNWFNNSDDSIAVNAAEGYGGTIDGVAMDGNQCVLCLTAYRQLSNESGVDINAAIKNVTFTNGAGTLADSGGANAVAFRLGEPSASGGSADIMQSVKISNSTYVNTGAGRGMVEVDDYLGELSMSNVTWMSPAAAQPWLGFANGATISSFTCTACRIIRNTAGHAAAWWATIPNGDAITRMEFNGASVENEQGQTYSALSYALDVQSGGSVGTLVLTALDPALSPTLLNGNEWSRVTNFYGSGVSTFFRNVTYAGLPPATYSGLKASISDSSAGGVWGAVESGGSAGHYAEETSNGTNWTVTGK